MKPKSHELIAGVVVIVAVGLFLVFLAAIGGGLQRFTAKTVPAVAYFQNISALKAKNQVTYQGVLIGEIKDIKYEPLMDRIRVELDIFADYAKGGENEVIVAGKQAVAIVTQATFLGDQYIEITSQLDQLPKERLDKIQTAIQYDADLGKLLIGALDPSSIGMIMTAATGVLDDVKGLTGHFDAYSAQISNTLASAENAAAGAERILGDPALAADLKMTAENARVATGDVRIATAKLPATVDEAWAMMSAGRGAAQQFETMIAENRPKIGKIMTNADELTMNARVLSYGLAESPWMLVWKDKEWQKRVQKRDPALLAASLYDTSPLSLTSDPALTTVPRSNYTATEDGVQPRGFQYNFNVSGN